jgi:hypothetical protein
LKIKKEKKGISVKKFPGINRIEGGIPSKFLIPGEFFADSRQQRGYGVAPFPEASKNRSDWIMRP